MNKHLSSSTDPTSDAREKLHENFCDFFQIGWGHIQQDVFSTAVDHGWWDAPRSVGEIIALIHSEASEALEAFRHGNPPDDKIPNFSGAEAELADIVIRIMDFCEHEGFNLSAAIIAKTTYNKTRPYKHGNKAF